MSRSADYYVLIRGGQRSCYTEVWGALRRELVFGPAALEEWLTTGELADEAPDDLSGLAIVDFDSKVLLWGETEPLEIPAVHSCYQTLLASAWPGFTIQLIPRHNLHVVVDALEDEHPQTDAVPAIANLASPELTAEIAYDEQPTTVAEAANDFLCDFDSNHLEEDELAEDEADDDDDLEAEDDDEDGELPFTEDNEGVWLTTIDKRGKLSQRGLSALPLDLLDGLESAQQDLTALPGVDIPEERYVKGGMVIDHCRQEIGCWGGESPQLLSRLRAGWPAFHVDLLEGGYSDHCQRCHVSGKSLSQTQTLAILLPSLLNNRRVSFATLFQTVGGSVKRTAIQATGCLIFLLSLPLLLAGLFLNRWREIGYAWLTMVVIIAIGFKIIEYRIKAKYRDSIFGQSDQQLATQRPPVAGPTDLAGRKRQLDKLLVTSGLPEFSKVAPHMENLTGFTV